MTLNIAATSESTSRPSSRRVAHLAAAFLCLTLAISTAAIATLPSTSSAATMTVPGAPTIGTAIPGNGQATVSWTPPVSDARSPITGYIVTAYVGYAPVKARIFNSPYGTTRTVTGLTNDTTYRFRVSAYNDVGTSTYSKATKAVTPSASSTPPGAPTAVTATWDLTTPASARFYTVSWTAPTSDGGAAITGYVVTPYQKGNAQEALAVTFTGTATTGTLTLPVANCHWNSFTVAAINSYGTGPQSVLSNAPGAHPHCYG